jgi:hypothetical protein
VTELAKQTAIVRSSQCLSKNGEPATMSPNETP